MSKKKTAESETAPKIGRPAGAPNITETFDVDPSRCAKCQSTERSPYFGTPEVQPFEGLRDGKPFTHIVRQRCTCANCGQNRFDRTYENRKALDQSA